MTAASTPCIRVCTLDPSGRLCTGCGRTIEEIGAWGALDEATRRAIMAGLPSRLESASQPVSACSRQVGSREVGMRGVSTVELPL